MQRLRKNWMCAAALAACLPAAGALPSSDAALATADMAATAAVPTVTPAEAASAAPPPSMQWDGGADGLGIQSVDAARLDTLRGGTETVTNDLKLSGMVSGNTAVNVATGSNIITNGSFSNATGLPVAIQNSGANVLIQNATIINIQLH